MRSKWPDFLFTVAVRVACGAVLGVIASIVICAPISRHAQRRPLLVLIFGDAAHPWRPYYWFTSWALGGAFIALATIPKWKAPWYHWDSEELSDLTDLGIPGDGKGKHGPNAVTKSVTIRTVSEDGQEREYSSMDEVPPELRSEIEALEKEAVQQQGEQLSVTERSHTGNEITSKVIFRKRVSRYKLVDESGTERVYHSLEEMPPEIRAAIAEAQNKSKG